MRPVSSFHIKNISKTFDSLFWASLVLFLRECFLTMDVMEYICIDNSHTYIIQCVLHKKSQFQMSLN